MLTLLADRVFDGVRFLHGPTRIDLLGDRIAAVRPLAAGGSTPPAGDRVIDCRGGATVLPGLVNAHVHIARGGTFGENEPISPAQMALNLEVTLAAGVTTVGDMGCPAGVARALRRHVAANPGAGPAIVAAGPVLTAPRGYPLDWLPAHFTKLGVIQTCGTEREGCAAVEAVAESGMDHVKIAVMHRSYAERPLPALAEPVARAIVREAHSRGLRVLAHAHSTADYRVALAGGADAMMHSSFEPLDSDLVARIRDAGVPVCPTLWIFDSVCLGADARFDRDRRYTSGVSRAIAREWSRFCEAYAAAGDVLPPGIAGGLPKSRAAEAVRIAAANLLLLRDSGVPVAFGTDSSYGFCVHGRPIDELLAMRRAGLEPAEVLAAATSGAASLLALADRGTIAPGRRADLVIVDGDPGVDLAAMERVRAVIATGRIVQARSPGQRALARASAGIAAIRGLAATAADAIRRQLRA